LRSWFVLAAIWLLSAPAFAQFTPIGAGDGGLALVQFAGGELKAQHTLPAGATLRQRDGTQWTLIEGTRFMPTAGDVNGDRRDDVVAWGPKSLAVLGYQPPQRGTEAIGFQLLATVNNGVRAGNWQVDTSRQILHGLGDFNGDGRAELVLTGPNAIGLLSLDGGTLTTVAMHVNGTRLGGWIIDTPKNRIEGLGDFNGDGRTDILITSGWGIGILTLGDKGLTSLMLRPNGTRFGGWLYDSAVNNVRGVGDFNGDKRTDILITSGWGIGVLTLAGDTLDDLMLKPNGTRFGGWLYDSAVNNVRGVGDLDGNARDDFIITSGWGIGVLTLAGDTFNSLMLKPKGTRFGGWLYAVENEVGQIGDVDGNGRDDFVIRSGWGTGLLTLAGDTFNSLVLKPNGTDLGLWVLGQDDVIPVVGRLAGGSSDVLLFHREGPPPADREPAPVVTAVYPKVIEVRAPETVLGGTDVRLSVVLDQPTDNGLSVVLKSSRQDVIAVPERLAFQADASVATLNLTSARVADITSVEISAQLILESGASGATATVQVDPAPTEPPPEEAPGEPSPLPPPPPPPTAPVPEAPPATGPAYLQLGDLQGDVVETGYVGQIRVLAWSWRTSRAANDGTTSTEVAGADQSDGISISADNSKATPKLLEALTSGQTFPTATLTVIDPATGLPAQTINMGNVLVTEFSASVSAGDQRPTSSFSLEFQSFDITP
jgi:type VI protein secretion system component Hcp